jgi:hypothetical protein
MKIIRWISCHLILLIVLISVAVGWYFRAELASDYARMVGQAPGALASSSGAEETERLRQQSGSHEAPTIDMSTRNGPGAVQEKVRTGRSNATPQSHFPVRQTANTTATTRPSMPTESQDPSSPADFPGTRDDTSTAAGASTEFPGDAPFQQPTPGANVQEPEADPTEAMYPPDDYDPEMDKSTTGMMERSSQQGETGPFPGMVGSAPSVADFPSWVPGNDVIPGDFEQPTRQTEVLPGQADSTAMRPQASAEDYQSQLESARRLYWGGDLDAARQEYEKLVMNYPDMPESASELGNLLMQQNLSEEAERAYDTAVANFRHQHRDDEAIGLIRFISRYNRTLADTLYNKYWQ